MTCTSSYLFGSYDTKTYGDCTVGNGMTLCRLIDSYYYEIMYNARMTTDRSKAKETVKEQYICNGIQISIRTASIFLHLTNASLQQYRHRWGHKSCHECWPEENDS